MTDRARNRVTSQGTGYRYGGMQVLPEYKKRLDPGFLKYYSNRFTGSRMVYVHWSAGPRGVNFTDYHRMVLVRDGRAISQSNENSNIDLHAHTFGRNTNSCAISLAGFYKATTIDLGTEVATPAQLRKLVKDIVEICLNLDAPVANVMSHAEAADNVDQGPTPPYPTPGLLGADSEAYGPLSGHWERWDLHVLIDKKTLELHPPLGKKVLEPSGNLIPLMDWVRGEALLNLQDATYKYWGK